MHGGTLTPARPITPKAKAQASTAARMDAHEGERDRSRGAWKPDLDSVAEAAIHFEGDTILMRELLSRRCQFAPDPGTFCPDGSLCTLKGHLCCWSTRHQGFRGNSLEASKVHGTWAQGDTCCRGNHQNLGMMPQLMTDVHIIDSLQYTYFWIHRSTIAQGNSSCMLIFGAGHEAYTRDTCDSVREE